MTIKWIFDDDEHFLKSCGIEHYPTYEEDVLKLTEERAKEIMTKFNEFNTDLDYFDEVPTEDPFMYDAIPSDIPDPLNQEELDYQLEVKIQLANAIAEFLVFGTKQDLLNFINSQTN